MFGIFAKERKSRKQAGHEGKLRSTRSSRYCRPWLEPLEDRFLFSVNLLGVPNWVAEGPAPGINGGDGNVPSEFLFLPPSAASFFENPVSGAIEALAVQPNSNVVYVGGVNGGIWRTNDITASPVSWLPLTDQFPALQIACLQFDPTDGTNQTLVAGIGATSSLLLGGALGPLTGLLKTTDGGNTWTQLGNAPQDLGGLQQLQAVSVVPRGNTILVGTPQGVYRSTDGGSTFQNISGMNMNGYVNDLVGDPSNPNRVYAAIADVGVFRSDNLGGFWYDVTDNAIRSLLNAPDEDAMGKELGNENLKISVSGVGAPNNTVYLALEGPVVVNNVLMHQGVLGLFRSQTQGNQWAPMDVSGVQDTNAGGQGSNFALLADPDNVNLVYVAGDIGGVLRGDFATNHWEQLAGPSTANGSYPHPDSRAMTIVGGKLLYTSDGGIFEETSPRDANGQWLSKNGNIQVTQWTFVSYDSVSHIILGPTQDTGTEMQLFQNSPYYTDLTGGDGHELAVDDLTMPSQSIRYMDFKRTYYDSSNKPVPFPVPLPPFFNTSIDLIPQGGINGFNMFNFLAVSKAAPPSGQSADVVIGRANDVVGEHYFGQHPVPGAPLVESTNAGIALDTAQINWTQIPTGNGWVGVNKVFGFNAIAVGATDNPSVIYAGSANQVFVRTTAGGPLNPATPLPDGAGTIGAIAIDPNNSLTAYVTANVNDLDSSRVFQTTDGGKSWHEITGNLSTIAGATGAPNAGDSSPSLIRVLQVVDGSAGNVLLAGGTDGVFRMFTSAAGRWTRYDGGAGSRPPNGDFPNAAVWGLQYGSPDVLVAATYGRGAFEVQHASNTLFTPGVLQINGDSATNNIIDLRLDPNNSSFLEVTVNGQVEYDAPFVYFSTIAIIANHYQDQVQVEDAPVGTQVQITSGQLGNVTVGKNGTLQGILGDVHLSYSTDFATLTIDDSADASNHIAVPVTISNSSVTGLSVGTITYDQRAVGVLNVNVAYDSGSRTSSTFDVLSTPNASSVFPGESVTNLTTGGGDQVVVGQKGSLQGIAGTIFIGNGLAPLAETMVTVDDSHDQMAQTQVTLEPFTNPITNLLYEAIENLAPANICLADGEVNSAIVKLGAPASGNIVTVVQTTPNTAIAVQTGPAEDTVNIHGNNGPLIVDPKGGLDTVNIGNAGLVQGIAGGITIRPGLTTLGVDDSKDLNPRTLTVTSQGLDNGLNPNGMLSPWLTYSGLASVTISGGTPAINGVPTGSGNIFSVLTTGAPVTIKAGSGGDTVKLGDATHSLDAIAGSVNVIGSTNTHLILDDEATQNSIVPPFPGDTSGIYEEFQNSPVYTITYQGVERNNILTDTQERLVNGVPTLVPPFNSTSYHSSITFTNIAGLELDGANLQDIDNTVTSAFANNSSCNAFNVQSMLGSTPLQISAGNGGDTVKVGDATDSLNQIADTGAGVRINVTGSTSTHLILDDRATQNAVTDPLPVQGFDGSIDVNNPLYAITDHQTYQQVQRTNNLLHTDLVVNNHGTITTVGPVTATLLTTVTYTNVAALEVDGANLLLTNHNGTNQLLPQYSSSNTFNVEGVHAGTNVTVRTGDGGDTVNVDSAANSIDPILGTVDVEGAGNTKLTVNDSGTSTINNWEINAASIDRYPFGGTPPAMPQITYHNLATVTVTAGTARTFINIHSTAAGATIVNGNNSGDEFIVGDSGERLDEIQAPLMLHGSGLDFLSAVDSGNTIGRTYNVTTGLLQRVGMASITFDGMGEFVLSTANNPNGHTSSTVNVQSLNTVFNVFSIARGDMVMVGQNGSMAGILGELRFQGAIGQTPGQIILDDHADSAPRTTTPITLQGNDPTFGYVVGGLLPNGGRTGFLSLDATTPVSILGGPADKVFRIHDFSGALAISLVAEPAGSTRANMHNKLDYSAYTGRVEVILPLGMATGFASVSGIQDVAGGIGNSLLVGDAGANILVGGTLRNILIGGLGSDTLIGGPGEDILIAGYTDYDKDPQLTALNAIMAEWTSGDSYQTRYSFIKSGGGLNGSYILDKTTVHGDQVKNTLTGGAGQDWFFDNKFLDVITDLVMSGTGKEHVTPI